MVQSITLGGQTTEDGKPLREATLRICVD